MHKALKNTVHNIICTTVLGLCQDQGQGVNGSSFEMAMSQIAGCSQVLCQPLYWCLKKT